MFEWKDSYLTGICEIDRQHLQLFHISNQLWEVASVLEFSGKADRIAKEVIRLADCIENLVISEETAHDVDVDTHQTDSVDENLAFVNFLRELDISGLETTKGSLLKYIGEFICIWVKRHLAQSGFQCEDKDVIKQSDWIIDMGPEGGTLANEQST